MMFSTVALIGRPNVGKSTLFNRLTQSQNALVADFPGLTRDRQYGEVQLYGRNFLLIDTGGIGVENAEIDALMAKQTKIALEETTDIWLVVDGRAGLMPDDQKLAAQLRKLNKPIILLINKIDGVNEATVLNEFQSLGFKQTYLVSAAHGHGIECFLSRLDNSFSSDNIIEDLDSSRIKITFVGRPNVGKSTLINRLLGEERVVVCDQPGTTRDSIAIPFDHNEQAFLLIDTAGVRRRSRIEEKIEKFSIVKTLQAVKQTNVCLMVIDGAQGLTEQDMQLLAFIIESGKALVIAVNKWDNLTEEHKESVKNELIRRLHFANFAKMRFISALHGSGVGILFKDIRQAFQSAMQSMSTPKLTRLLEDIVASHPPPLVKSRRIKLRYAHNGGHNPPTIIIHGNQLEALPQSYKRYLNNAFIEALQLKGTPLELIFKVNNNPYKDKRNKLTPRQIHKKKRLMKWVKKKKN